MVSTRPTCSWNLDARTPATDSFLKFRAHSPRIIDLVFLLSAYNPHTLIMCVCMCRYVADQKYAVSSREVYRIP